MIYVGIDIAKLTTEQKLSALAQRVADEKLSTKFLEWKTRPHLTLACFNDVDEEK